MHQTAKICGTPETVIEAAAQWPRSCMRLTLASDWSRLAGMSSGLFADATDHSLQNCSAVSGLQIATTIDEREADIRLAGEAMQGGILAYAYFPSGNCAEQLQTRFNSRVSWTPELFADTLTHELGHAFGLPHTSDSRDIMYPTILEGRDLDARYGPHYSIPELIRRYGPPADEPQPPNPGPGPMPPIDILTIIREVISLIRECNQDEATIRQRLLRPRLFDGVRLIRQVARARPDWELTYIRAAIEEAREQLTREDADWLIAEARNS